MDIEDLWKNSIWTLKAREILKAIEEFPENSKIILVLRHSHRDEPKGEEKLHKLKLTELGHDMAKKFGEGLPKDRTIRLFHSIVWRCQETAEDILDGFGRMSGRGKIKGVIKPLFFAGTAPNYFIEIFKNGSPIRFLYQWAAGHFSPENIMPFQKYSENAANIIWNGLKNAPEKGIDIHVTHDIFLIALRYGWFGLPPTKEWVPFLGGFAFIIRNNKITLFDNNEFIEIDTPHWWKNINK
ncbi:MAG: hypothetical protein ACTSPN_09035 [Promethearchaeota archaeon]